MNALKARKQYESQQKKEDKVKIGDIVYTNISGTHLYNMFKITEVNEDGFGNGIYSWTWDELGFCVFTDADEATKLLRKTEKK